ncbi:hypothetical protein [Streptomyces sp. HUAS TT20]|uniref:hypothetical protein n=1 Tax=Streptomyces sp. HUAS TT20 TaxID=3447509 RepID=UPI0021D8A7BD|nr:hypothetical protein [Streptomyces sp. HUAS 15-9]UXY32068.1 hypothetical protein N8I87_39640 [Streptomyces sp. HUAS 15-9]
MHKWTATVAAVSALAISLYNFAELQRQPSVDMTLPHLIRLEWKDNEVHFYVQPTVATRFKTESVEVIRDARLHLAPTGSISSSKRPAFYWEESDVWAYNLTSGSIDPTWSNDPAPFIVSQDKPQQPAFKFSASNWIYQAGRYEASLELLRSADHTPLIKRFCLIISDAAINELKNPQPPDQTIRFFRNDLPKFTSSGSSPGCYRLWDTG